jgi:circadian clock protein KaiB
MDTGQGRPHTGSSAGDDGALVLRLYVAGPGPNSALALANLRALLERVGLAGARVEVVDCFRDPRRALEDGVIVTPMLVKLGPEPRASIIGSLSDRPRLAAALGLRDGEEG